MTRESTREITAVANLDFARRHAKLAVTLATRFAPLTPELVKRHRSKLDKNLLAQNPHVRTTVRHDSGGADFPTESPNLEEAWRRFCEGRSEAASDARVHAFLDATRPTLDALYVTSYRMCGRDWEGERESGWTFLASVRELDWSEALVVALADRLDFRRLSANPSVPWTESLLAQFEDRWAWEALARNESLPWSEALLDRFPKLPVAALSSNERFPWTAGFLERHADQLDWPALSSNRAVAWTRELVARFSTRVSWDALVTNPSCVCAEELIDEHADAIDWEALAGSHSFEWTPAMLRKFADRIDWRALSARASLWTTHTSLLEEFADRVDFGSRGLSINSRVTWTSGLLERYLDRLDSRELSRNESVWTHVFAPILDIEGLDQLLASARDRNTGGKRPRAE